MLSVFLLTKSIPKPGSVPSKQNGSWTIRINGTYAKYHFFGQKPIFNKFKGATDKFGKSQPKTHTNKTFFVIYLKVFLILHENLQVD